MTREQIKQIEHSYKHGDALVFRVGEKVFVTDSILKHRKEATIEMVDCNEVDETCFANNGEYYGDTLPKSYRIILNDPYADNENVVAAEYYEDELVSMHEEVKR